jgi:hypothetical protein
MSEKFKKIVVMDFDGVIHSCKSGWKGVTEIPDPPVEGVKEFIEKLRENYLVIVFSSRTCSAEGRYAIRDWLFLNGIEVDDIVEHKPPAFITIDDRAICFNGSFKGLKEQIDTFEPWTRKGKLF